MPSPPKRAHKAAGTRRDPVDQLANLGEPSAQLGVADLDRHQRVLERNELAFRAPDRLDQLSMKPFTPVDGAPDDGVVKARGGSP